jgi:dTDP-glucose 4,6-dehydratase
MKTVLLTGFAGFIGSQILRDLIDKGYFVVGVDNMSEGSDADNYIEFKDHAQFQPIILDLNDERLDNILKHILTSCTPKKENKVDFIINCAADSHVDRSWDQIGKFIDSNIKGPVNLARWALKTGVEKFVQVSTDEVWGGGEQPFVEGGKFVPENIYSSSKASAEFFLDNFRKAYNLPLVVTNGANTYGKRQMNEKIIPKSVSRLVSGDKIPLFETPAQRMWLHVEDHSSGILAAMEHGVAGEKYCLAPDLENELFTHELVGKICDILGKDYQDSVEIVPDRLNYDLRYYMLNDKSKKDLSWKPRKKINEELPAIVMWFKNKFKEEH